MKYIDNEIILQRKMGLLIYIYIMIIIVFMLSLIILCFLFHYNVYYKIRGVVEYVENNYYIRIYIPIEDIMYITTNDSVTINKNEYTYSVYDIDNEYFTDNNKTYQVVKIKCNLDKKYRFNNLTVDLKFLRNSKRIIDYILK